jgi:hypothetical protein
VSGQSEDEAWREVANTVREGLTLLQIAEAERGHRESARSLAGLAAKLLKQGKPLPDCLRAWLCDHLERIEAGKAPPFGPLKRNGRGRMGMSVSRMIEIKELFAQARGGGMSAEEAAEAVGEVLGASPRTVRKVWAAFRDEFPASMGGTGPEPEPFKPCVLPVRRSGKK